MKRFLALAVLFGLFAGFVGCGETTPPPAEKPAVIEPADQPPPADTK